MLEQSCLREVVAVRKGQVSLLHRQEGPQRCGAARKRPVGCSESGSSSRRRRRSECGCSSSRCGCSSQPVEGSSREGGVERWDNLTSSLVGASTLPFVLLLLPQMARNAINMTAGNSSALSILSWMVRLNPCKSVTCSLISTGHRLVV